MDTRSVGSVATVAVDRLCDVEVRTVSLLLLELAGGIGKCFLGRTAGSSEERQSCVGVTDAQSHCHHNLLVHFVPVPLGVHATPYRPSDDSRGNFLNIVVYSLQHDDLHSWPGNEPFRAVRWSGSCVCDLRECSESDPPAVFSLARVFLSP